MPSSRFVRSGALVVVVATLTAFGCVIEDKGLGFGRRGRVSAGRDDGGAVAHDTTPPVSLPPDGAGASPTEAGAARPPNDAGATGGARGFPDASLDPGEGLDAGDEPIGTSPGSPPPVSLPPPQPREEFRHPGVLINQSQLDFLKAKVAAGEQPWKTAFERATRSDLGSLAYVPQPVANVVCGPESRPDVGCTAEMNDVAAAYTHALLWHLSGKEAHAKKAIEIMNAWSAVLTTHSNNNAALQTGWCGSVFPRAAEIIRATYDGWPAAEVERFAGMLRKVYLPGLARGSGANGYWELSMIEAMGAIAVFTDDRASFNQAVAMWKRRVPAYLHMRSDGERPVAPPSGGTDLTDFWYGQTTFQEDGVGQETCRDLAHQQYGLAAMVNFAETAYLQGIDLYQAEGARIMAGLELHARLLNGASVPSWLCRGRIDGRSPYPMWEIAYNHYALRLGHSLPQVQRLLPRVRPSGVNHHMIWETLSHGDVGAGGVGIVVP
jgi:hypothetical protein